MTSEQEIERIVRVYRSYHESPSIREQWDSRNRGNRAIVRERQREIARLLSIHGFYPLQDRRILDVGCGSGYELSRFVEWGAVPENLYGVDLLPYRIDTAKRRFPDIHFQQGNAEKLDFDTTYFDLILLFTVFTSILDDGMMQNIAAEVNRVLKPGGAVIWYDFRYNNPRNPNVRKMTKRMLIELFPGYSLDFRSITLLPPLARRLGYSTHVLYPLLMNVHFLRTHYLGFLIKQHN